MEKIQKYWKTGGLWQILQKKEQGTANKRQTEAILWATDSEGSEIQTKGLLEVCEKSDKFKSRTEPTWDPEWLSDQGRHRKGRGAQHILRKCVYTRKSWNHANTARQSIQTSNKRPRNYIPISRESANQTKTRQVPMTWQDTSANTPRVQPKHKNTADCDIPEIIKGG